MKKINELRDYLLENYVDEYGCLDISGLDFSEFDGNIHVNRMKVKGNLYQDEHDVEGDLFQTEHKVKGDLFQSYHEVEGDLSQNRHEVKGYLSQSYHEVEGDLSQSGHEVKGDLSQGMHNVEGDLYQGYHEVKGNYHSTDINVAGTINFEEPKKALKEVTEEDIRELFDPKKRYAVVFEWLDVKDNKVKNYIVGTFGGYSGRNIVGVIDSTLANFEEMGIANIYEVDRDHLENDLKVIKTFDKNELDLVNEWVVQ